MSIVQADVWMDSAVASSLYHVRRDSEDFNSMNEIRKREYSADAYGSVTRSGDKLPYYEHIFHLTVLTSQQEAAGICS